MARETKLQKFAKEQAEIVKKRWKKSIMDYVVVKNGKSYKVVRDNNDWDYPEGFVAYLDEAIENN